MNRTLALKVGDEGRSFNFIASEAGKPDKRQLVEKPTKSCPRLSFILYTTSRYYNHTVCPCAYLIQRGLKRISTRINHREAKNGLVASPFCIGLQIINEEDKITSF